MSKTLIILKTGSPYAELKRQQGDFVNWIRQRLGDTDFETVVVDAEAGGALPQPQNGQAVIITGSHAMITERRAWSERCAVWLKEAVQGGMPVLGICYGHQLLAHALGGEVGRNPHGREFGTVEIQRTPAAESDRLFSALPERFEAQVCHTQSVLHLPAGAVVLAESARDGAQAVRYGENVWGVQFHPEFNAAAMRFYLRRFEKRLTDEGQDVRRLLEEVRETPLSGSLIQKFCELVL